MDQLLSEALDLILDGHCEDALARLDLISSDDLEGCERAEFLYWRGVALCRLNRYEEGEQAFRQGIREFPDQGRFYRSVGQLLSETGCEEESLVYFAKSGELAPDDPVNAYEWGYALYKLERDSEAIERFEDALRLDASCGTAIRYLGEIYCIREEHEKAFESYTRYLERVPKDSSILVEAAICLSDLERFEEACEYYRKARAAEPGYVYTYYNWAVSLWRHGKLDQAMEKVRECLDVAPEFPLGWMLRGRLELAMGEVDKALSTLDGGMRRARAASEDDAEVVAWCYESYLDAMIDLQRLEDAQAVFWEAARTNLLTQVMLEQFNGLSAEESNGLALWWVLLDVRLYEPVPVEDLDSERAAGYLCGFSVLAKDPDDAVGCALEFEQQLGEGDAILEECLLQEDKLTGIPGVSWVHPNRNYYSGCPEWQ